MSENLEPEVASEAKSEAALGNIGKIHFRLKEKLLALWVAAGPTAERVWAWANRKPRILHAAVFGLAVAIVLALTLPQSLTAALQATLPERIAGNDAVSASAERRATRAYLSPHANGQLPAHDKVALNDAARFDFTSSDGGYLPEGERGTSPITQKIITIPVSQGRLLRFDEAVESVFIADPSIADIRMVSSDLVYIYGKSLGLTNLMAISGAGDTNSGASGVKQQVTASALLRVVADTRPAKEAQYQWSPETPVDIEMFGRRTAIQGRMRNIDEAVDATNIAETYSAKDQPPLNNTTLSGSNQINIRVRFAEASRNDLKAFGIDWNLMAGGGSFSFGLAKTGQTQNPNVSLGVESGNFSVDLLIEALQANGALTILAEPNLTAVTGETASFLAGGEVPIPVPTGQGGESITVQYKPFGVSLLFTPTLVKDNRIALRVKPEVSSIAANTSFAIQGFNLPSFTVRRAETTVEVASGQTFAMAGLFQREVSRNVDKLPLLGDLPVLGPLFRSERYQRNETELVILITPYLVDPVSDGSLATPLDRAGHAHWRADIVDPDPTGKGAALTEPAGQSGFILK